MVDAMLTLDDVRFLVTVALQSAAWKAHKKEIAAGVCFDCGALLYDGGELDICPRCQGAVISRSDVEIVSGNVTATMKRARGAVKVADVMADAFGFVAAFPTVSPLPKARGASTDATRPVGAFPAFGIEWDSVFPAAVQPMLGVASVAEMFPGVTLAHRCVFCAALHPATEGETCETCDALLAEAYAQNEALDMERRAASDAGAFTGNMERLDSFEDWLDAIGGDDALAEMDDDTIDMLARLDAAEASMAVRGRSARQQKAGS